MKIKNSILFLLVAFLIISCDEKRVFDEYKSVGNSWHKDSIIKFKLPKLDSLKNYNLYVNTRANNDYPFSNLFLIVSLVQPNKKVLVDTLEYEMANPDGSLMGDGFSDVKESKLFYKPNVKFNLKGDYTIKIQQAVRQTGKVAGVDNLKGITEIGFRVESLE
ncbi:gliding motility lipoprotein GldH [Flavobacterium aquatile]|uniref:Gliding motility protein GldH n=1 Tax=Flavobacterium aquatile LMG 4008 = ATCC 11947 TaxID=1453498 RepID=A0A095V1X7_9FLAO|nr:gliding motility lipoprotein GldH [Flavobacterium aquatile]KGD68860.1 gliding motility protein GldH [Flavobacterium aquatile LMG 4008 = ATCC 11947]OXA69375.1 gliding motility lipoprotein GldH [Flavobacterium aquatile LMG 4008 = ATCC 11947]GEC79349.1 gliding motility lipoprotein GldH [Flavobacterium aquatile]